MHLLFTPEELNEIRTAALMAGAPDPETFMKDAIIQATDEVFDQVEPDTLPVLRLFPKN